MDDKELARVIGRNVKAVRTAAALTQKGLGDKTGLSIPAISRLEGGADHLPSVATLKKIADALEVPICKLLDPVPGEAIPPEGPRPAGRPASKPGAAPPPKGRKT
jgi:transcriptional regulator with XRE-family HTH domain